MSKVGVSARLVTGRTIRQGRAMELGKWTERYRSAVNYCEVDPVTFEVLGINNGDPVRVESLFGSVVVYCRMNKHVPPAIVFMPCGPYANALIPDDTVGSGMPDFKETPVTLFPAYDEPVPTIEELLRGVMEE